MDQPFPNKRSGPYEKQVPDLRAIAELILAINHANYQKIDITIGSTRIRLDRSAPDGKPVSGDLHETTRPDLTQAREIPTEMPREMEIAGENESTMHKEGGINPNPAPEPFPLSILSEPVTAREPAISGGENGGEETTPILDSTSLRAASLLDMVPDRASSDTEAQDVEMDVDRLAELSNLRFEDPLPMAGGKTGAQNPVPLSPASETPGGETREEKTGLDDASLIRANAAGILFLEQVDEDTPGIFLPAGSVIATIDVGDEFVAVTTSLAGYIRDYYADHGEMIEFGQWIARIAPDHDDDAAAID